MEPEHVAAADTSMWYGYDIHLHPGSKLPYSVRIFTKDYPRAEVGSHSWTQTTYYRAWFATLEEARDAAESFCDEMHYRREAEELGVGEELSRQANDEVREVAEELRRLAAEDLEEFAERCRELDRQRQDKETAKK